MRKFAVVVAVMLGLMAISKTAAAAPIGVNGCSQGQVFYECDIFADYGDGSSDLGAPDNLGGYLTGYALLLNASADLSDGLDEADVAHILIIHDSLFELFSNIVFSSVFTDAFNAAKNSTDIDGNPVQISQIGGCPVASGVASCTSADVVSLLPDTIFGNDVLRIHTALRTDEEVPNPAPVPEPATISLLAFGGSAAAAAIRRRRAAKQG